MENSFEKPGNLHEKKEKVEDKNVLNTLETEESSVEFPVENLDNTKKKIMKACRALTMGIMFFCGTVSPVFAGEKSGRGAMSDEQELKMLLQEKENEMEKIKKELSGLEGAKYKQEHEKRMSELQNWVDEFQVKDLKIGEARDKMRTHGEQYGIYIGEQWLGDIRSFDKDYSYDGDEGSFSKDEFMDKVSALLKNLPIMFSNNKIEFNDDIGRDAVVEITADAQKILDELGGSITKTKIDTGKGDFFVEIGRDTKSVKVTTIGGKLLVIAENKDGGMSMVTFSEKGEYESIKEIEKQDKK